MELVWWNGGKNVSVYSYEVAKTSGETESLEKYDGQVLLIVNTASK